LEIILLVEITIMKVIAILTVILTVIKKQPHSMSMALVIMMMKITAIVIVTATVTVMVTLMQHQPHKLITMIMAMDHVITITVMKPLPKDKKINPKIHKINKYNLLLLEMIRICKI
jgi:hypothetical protein